jgi:phenylacetate-CoA ligase
MSDHFDAFETRDPAQREREQFARLPGVIANALRGPGWAAHLAGVDPRKVSGRAALAKLPLLRKSDLPTLQRASPPFGGFNVISPREAKRLMVSPGPIFELEGQAEDVGGAARALHAAGIRKGDILHNAFSYHLTPGAWMLEAGAHALGCAVIPGGIGNTEQQVAAIAHLRPSAYVGTPDFLKILLDTAQKSGQDVSCLKRGLVSGAALPSSLREELTSRGVAAMQCYAAAETGVIAYETSAGVGMVVNENLLIEIVRPGTGEPVPDGEVGEVVVTTFNPDYPMIRLATVVRTHQHAHPRMDGTCRSNHQSQRHVRAPRTGRRARPPPSRAWPGASQSHARTRAGCDDALGRGCRAQSGAIGSGRRNARSGYQTAWRC